MKFNLNIQVGISILFITIFQCNLQINPIEAVNTKSFQNIHLNKQTSNLERQINQLQYENNEFHTDTNSNLIEQLESESEQTKNELDTENNEQIETSNFEANNGIPARYQYTGPSLTFEGSQITPAKINEWIASLPQLPNDRIFYYYAQLDKGFKYAKTGTIPDDDFDRIKVYVHPNVQPKPKYDEVFGYETTGVFPCFVTIPAGTLIVDDDGIASASKIFGIDMKFVTQFYFLKYEDKTKIKTLAQKVQKYKK
jgi:hypothetical protein